MKDNFAIDSTSIRIPKRKSSYIKELKFSNVTTLTNLLAPLDPIFSSNRPYILNEEIFGVHVLENKERYHRCGQHLAKYH